MNLVWLQEHPIGGLRRYSLHEKTEEGFTQVATLMQEPECGWNTGRVADLRIDNPWSAWEIIPRFDDACAVIEQRVKNDGERAQDTNRQPADQ